MTARETFQRALQEGADDDALDVVTTQVGRDDGPAALVEVIKLRIAHERGRGKTDNDVTGLRLRLARALEEVARTTPTTDGAGAALEAAALFRETLNDSEAATRNLAHALTWGANNDTLLKRAIALAGGGETARSIARQTLKHPEVKADAPRSALLRRALSRLAETLGDSEAAFFEMLKAARKAPQDGLSIDDVHRLALATGRDTEAAAFFLALADEAVLGDRQRATILNKLGQTLERTGDQRGALAAYARSLRLHEAKVPKRAVERLAQVLGEPAPSRDAVPAADSVYAPIAAGEVHDATLTGLTRPDGDALLRSQVPPPPHSDENEAEIADEDVVSSERKPATRPAIASASTDEITQAQPAARDSNVDTIELPLTSSAVRAPLPSEAARQPVRAAPAGKARGHKANKKQPAQKKRKKSKAATPSLVSDEGAAFNDHAITIGSRSQRLTSATVEGPSSMVAAAVVLAANSRPDRPLPSSGGGQPRQRDLSSREHIEATTFSPAPLPHAEHAAATELAMTPLADPSASSQRLEASTPLSRALAALDSGSVEECVHAAHDLAAETASEPRILHLAGRALALTAGRGELSPAAVALFVEHAPRHGDRAASIALEIRQQLPPTARGAYVDLWLAGARAAGHNAESVLALLRKAAIDDAPDGPAFVHCEQVLTDLGDTQARDSLYQAAIEHSEGREKDEGPSQNAMDLQSRSDRFGVGPASGAAGAGGGLKRPPRESQGASHFAMHLEAKRTRLILLRIALLESQSRWKDALALHRQLAVDLASKDADVLRRARLAFAQHGTPDERARFLARLAQGLLGEDGVEVEREILAVRLSIDDRLGAEAAAQQLLSRSPGDARATQVLADLLGDDPMRTDELCDLLRAAVQQAMPWFDRAGETRVLLERLAAVQTRAGRRDEAADALVQVARLVLDEQALDNALAALAERKRYKEQISLLDDISIALVDTTLRVRMLLRAADIARQHLHKRGKARELIERAIDLAPRDRDALRSLADLLVDIGDVAAAVGVLERLVVEERDDKDRARTHLRLGRLLEEHLVRPEDALARYQSAAALDPTNKDVYSAMRAIARQRGDSQLLIVSLKGLASVEEGAKELASLWRQIAKVERDERVDSEAAEQAFAHALRCDAGDGDALAGLVSLFAARLQPDMDLDAALAQPSDALMAAVRPVIAAASAGADGDGMPIAMRRLQALGLSRDGDRNAAVQLFEQILLEHPEDLDTLMAFARHLATASRTELGAEARRLRVLEMILLHHAYSLQPPMQIDVWGEVTALRAATGDGGGARKAAKKVMALAQRAELHACLSDRAVRAVALALDEARDSERDAKSIVTALRLDAERSVVEAERARLLSRAAAICSEELKDLVLARQILQEALRTHPQSRGARDQLLDLELAGGDAAGALKHVRDALARETDAPRKAALHLRLFRLRRKLDLDIEGAAVELKTALELDPANDDLLATAEQFFSERNDVDGLDKLWSAQLRSLDRQDPRTRLKLLERLAQLRRYERRDFAGAIEALEAMSALDPDALKPREDAARLYSELGFVREAVAAWRGVLERDPLSAEAWRGMLDRFAHARQGDEAFAVASTMVALDIADHDLARIVRRLRPPFPRWPLPGKDPELFFKKVAHPLERAPAKNVIDIAGPRLLSLYARELKGFGLRRKDALAEKDVPPSVLLAVRTLARLLNLQDVPPLYAGSPHADETLVGKGGQAFAALPLREGGLIVAAEVLKGGMTPERAFALGRAASWLQPHAVLAASVDGPTLRLILEGLVAAFLGPKDLERPDAEAERLGKELGHALLKNRPTTEANKLKADLLPALRDYVHARQQVQVADWRVGVGYSADRVGYLMSMDLNAAFRMIQASSGQGQSIGARLAIKELVLFSVSSSYLSLRKDLGLALPDLAAAPLLDLG